jgi:serine/threonine-protein kinase RsbW
MMEEPAANWQIDKAIPNRVSDAMLTVRKVVEYLRCNGWPPEDIFGVHMALEETLMNAIKHGNAGDDSKRVHVRVRVWDDRIQARITDEGDGFDPDSVPDPCLEPNLDKTSGRGLILINSFVDKLEYIEPGNSVEFQKSKTTAEP